eukprot:7926394-Pyramimonas_sp.AAC.1
MAPPAPPTSVCGGGIGPNPSKSRRTRSTFTRFDTESCGSRKCFQDPFARRAAYGAGSRTVIRGIPWGHTC